MHLGSVACLTIKEARIDCTSTLLVDRGHSALLFPSHVWIAHGLLKPISYHFKTMVETITLVGICRVFESFRGVGGAK